MGPSAYRKAISVSEFDGRTPGAGVVRLDVRAGSKVSDLSVGDVRVRVRVQLGHEAKTVGLRVRVPDQLHESEMRT